MKSEHDTLKSGCDAQTNAVAPRVAIVIAAYDNGETLSEVIAGARAVCGDIIVVNDGSTDNTNEVLGGQANITVISFEKNRGKGCALRAGFARSAEMGFSHVITIDGDGQHMAQDLPRFLESVRKEPDTLWVGNRTVQSGGEVPMRSRFGRRFGNFWYRFNTGIALHDTQCGFRAYPLNAILALGIRGKRYEFEQDALIRAAWNGISVKEIDVRLNYKPASARISHFRPVRDFLRISVVNGKAGFVRVAFPVLTFEAPGRTLREKARAVVRHELRAHTTPKRAAFSVALGVFFGIFPIHTLQVATLMALTLVWPVNRPLAFLGVCVSSPPFLPLLIVATVPIGRLVVPSDLVAAIHPSTIQVFMQGGLEFIVGSAILAGPAAVAAFVVLYPLFVKLNKAGVLANRTSRT